MAAARKEKSQEQEDVILQLFDHYWSKYHILTNQRPSVKEESTFEDDFSYKKPKNMIRRKRRVKRSGEISKSSLMLEFEELKGFMDLGFEFSEEDKRSPRLVSILPGLQRLGGSKGILSNPSLSEVLRDEKIPPLLMMMNKNWKLPSLSDEDDMKNHLRVWALAVASAVR